MSVSPMPHPVPDNVVSRLKRRVQFVRSAGVEIRFERLADEQPNWCQLGNRRIIVLNQADTAN
ncbi:MAG: hypothetical protein AAF664_11600, partial [Planctomycetota bacterium]